jgi:hypothetical protein
MSNSYYVYNNEAISALVIKKYLEFSKSIDISRLFIILPFLLDDNLVEILLTENFDNIESLIDKYPHLFSSFNDKYLELIPITINSFTLLKEMNDVIIENGIISYVEGGLVNLNESSIGDRIIKIFFSINPFIELSNKHDTSSLYKILKVRL